MSHASHSPSATPAPESAPESTTQIVAALSLKGGVGKTSVVLGVAGAAASAGLKVLVIDLDPQANATATLNPESAQFTTSDVLYDGRPGIAADAIVPSSWEGTLDLIASEPALEHRSQSPGTGSELRLRTALDGVASNYDLVLFDCPPSLGELTRNALYAATSALVVTEPTFFAVQGAAQAIEAVRVVSEHGNPELKPAGIVVNRMRNTLEDHREHMADLQKEFGKLVLGGLPDRSAVPQAQGAQIPVQMWKSNGAADISKAIGLLLNRLVGKTVVNVTTTTVNLSDSTPRTEPTEASSEKKLKKNKTKKKKASTQEIAKTVDLTNKPESLANLTPTYRFTTSEDK